MDPSLDSTITVSAGVHDDTQRDRSDPATAEAEQADPELPNVAARLDKFSILRELGSGAMGVVYAAYDEQLGRKVAIKVVQQHLMRHASRFEREAQGLARLSHPNVVQIYEIGRWKDRLYIAMEFVAGQTLGAWIKDKPRSVDEVLRVFIDAGRGLAAAHAANLVHRDFKPDNVMVGDDGRARVMDFGLVHELGESKHLEIGEDSEADDIIIAQRQMESGMALSLELTQPGSLVGTPAYMAPEQHMGDPTDARSDQFSFCIALWEALYRKRPFAGKNWEELVDHVTAHKFEEMPREANVPSWIRAVMLRGLAVDPDDRWDTMDELLDALSSDPTKRRRWIIGATLGLALAATAWAGNQVRLENQRDAAAAAAAAEREAGLARCDAEGDAVHEVWTEALRQKAEAAFLATEHPVAEASWAKTRELLDAYAERWDAMQTQVCIDADVDQTRDAQWAALARECLDERREALGSLVGVLAEVPGDGGVLNSVIEAARLPSLRECTTERPPGRTMSLPEDPDARARVREALHLRAEIDALSSLGQAAQAREAAERLLAEAQTLHWPPLEAAAHYWIGRIAVDFDELDQAQTHLEDALFIAAAVEDRTALSAVSSLVYLSGYKRGDLSAAKRWGRLGQLLLEHAGATGSLAEAKLLVELGTVQARAKEYEQSVARYRAALDIYEAHLVPDHPDIAQALSNLGAAYLDDKKLDEAQTVLERSLEIYLANLPPDHPDLIYSHANLGVVCFEQDKLDRALDHYTSAIRLVEVHLGKDSVILGQLLSAKGQVLVAKGAMPTAREPLERSLAMLEPASDVPPIVMAMTRFALARVLWEQGETDAALELAVGARATYEDLGEQKKLAEVEAWLRQREPQFRVPE